MIWSVYFECFFFTIVILKGQFSPKVFIYSTFYPSRLFWYDIPRFRDICLLSTIMDKYSTWHVGHIVLKESESQQQCLFPEITTVTLNNPSCEQDAELLSFRITV